MNTIVLRLTVSILLTHLYSAVAAQTFAFTVSIKNPASHYLHVEMRCMDMKPGIIDFRMPVWTPGYYQYLNFHENVENLSISDDKGNVLEYAKNQANSWRIRSTSAGSYTIQYDIKTVRPFVATPYVDTSRAYISPPGVFLYPAGLLNKPVEVKIEPWYGWNRVATGLDSVMGASFTYRAENFDILFDSPILVGNLEELVPFEVEGKKHRFIGWKPGNFDGKALMADLKKIVTASSAIIGEIPYDHYTFIPIGPGGGGIEHLNSTTFSFTGEALNTPGSRIGVLNFLTHEYFHHYNVKRIRPVELGPFDYDRGSRTKQLWFSEGVTVYYEYLVMRRAGLTTDEELIESLRKNILGFENKPGKRFQSLAQSSYDTWSDGPFGRTGDEINKTISYYQKGPVVGWLFDFGIRHATNNERSLDDVMRLLYNKYYKGLNRGFTEKEFRTEVEKIAGQKLDELFDYVYTTKDLDYNKYLGFAGLTADTARHKLSGGWSGIAATKRNDSLVVTSVEYESPAYMLGIRKGHIISAIEGIKLPGQMMPVMSANQPGDTIRVSIFKGDALHEVSMILAQKTEQQFHISKLQDQNAMQAAIYKNWIGAEEQ